MDSYTRNFLRKRAHDLKPVVMVGKSGLDQRVVHTLVEALFSHELVKVKFVDFKESRGEIARQMAEKSGSELITVIGNIAVFYKEQEDPALRRYHVPKRKR